TGRIADGWRDNSAWAQVFVEYDEGRVDAHGGRSCQRITCRKIATGAVQLTQSALTLQEGVAYRAKVFARTPDGLPLRVQIRQPGPPYATYAERRFVPGPQWTPCQLTFTSPISGPALFMLIPGDLGTIYLDDASMEPADAEAGPPKEGNLLVTGRIVGGLANGWAPSEGPLDAFQYVPPSAQDPDPHVVIDGSRGSRLSLYSPPVVVNCGRTHTLSMDMKSDPPGAKVWVTVRDARGDRTGPGGVVIRPGADWGRHTLSGELPFVQADAFAVRINVLEPARVYVRNVQLVEGDGPVNFQPAVPVEVAVVPRAPNGLVFDGKSAALTVYGAGAIPEAARLKLTVHDLYGRVTRLPERLLSPGNSLEFTVEVQPAAERPLGMYRIEAEVLDAAGRSISNVGQGLVARVAR
ncbi:MAG: carbohydrate binding domain-containing protein, partial [Candidatus Brocadiae bacterium]|nr:carbohydrate binding domain-containing protein [Candidatus Brocadiia bacterium]